MYLVNVWGCSLARQRDTELSLRDGDALFWTRSLGGIGIMRFTPARFLGCRVARAEVAALLGPARRHADVLHSS
jgi:hypothetical protein